MGMRRFVAPVAVPALLALLGLVAFALARPADADDRFTNTAPPTIAGTPAVGQTLTINPGTWSSQPDAFTYEWLRDGEDTVVSEDVSYRPTRADAGHFITVLVTAQSDGDASTSSAESDRPTATVTIAPATGTAPRISGTARVGKTLKIVNGSWFGTPDRYAYRWYRNGAAISGAVKTSYLLRSVDQGRKITVKVTSVKAGYPSTTATSTATKAVAKK